MSLDVSLYSNAEKVLKKSSGIFIRENGEMKEITLEQWNEKFPNQEPVRMPQEEYETDCVYDANITHNLGEMAREADLYMYLWRPDELGITFAKDLIKPLSEGYTKLLEHPEKYMEFNPSNGWGDYYGLVKFVKNYLGACIEYPESTISISR